MKKVHSYQFRFPDDFLFGTAHSAYQSEGACDRDGKSESMMEYYAREKAGAWLPGLLHPEKVAPPRDFWNARNYTTFPT